MHCYKCISKPLLIKNDKEKKLQIKLQNKLCFGCGDSFEKLPIEYYCNCLEYFLCKFCRICSQGHYMKKTIYLENTNIAYMKNIFYCDICKKKDSANDNGIWHCSYCKYDICNACLD